MGHLTTPGRKITGHPTLLRVPSKPHAARSGRIRVWASPDAGISRFRRPHPSMNRRFRPLPLAGAVLRYPACILSGRIPFIRLLKNAICCVALHPFRLCVSRRQASWRRTICTPHSSGFARLASDHFGPACPQYGLSTCCN